MFFENVFIRYIFLRLYTDISGLKPDRWNLYINKVLPITIGNLSIFENCVPVGQTDTGTHIGI